MVFFVGISLVKMSMTLFNMRLTGLTSPKWKIAHWTFFGALVIYLLAAIFMNVFQCIPVSGNFDSVAMGKLDKPPKCMTENELGFSLSSIHVVMDFCLLAVPIIVIWKVQMRWAAKIRFTIMFGIGGVSAIGSLVRQVEQAKLKSDPLFNYTRLLQWTLVDITTGLITANLPTLGIFLPESWRSTSKNDSSRYIKKSGSLSQSFTHQSKNRLSQDWAVVSDHDDRPPMPPPWDANSQQAIVHNLDFELKYQDVSRKNSSVDAPDYEKTPNFSRMGR